MDSKALSSGYACARFRAVASMCDQRVGDDDEDGTELKADAPAHQLLAQIGAFSSRHIPQASKKHREDRERGDGCGVIEQRLHLKCLTNS